MTPRRLPLVLLGSLLIAAYFAYHGVIGTHGLQSYNRLAVRSGELERELRLLETVRDRLRKDVEALRAEPPSPDIVETFARSTLGMIRPGDHLVLGSRRR